MVALFIEKSDDYESKWHKMTKRGRQMIEFKNIEIKFDEFIAVQNLNLEINEGKFFTLLGPSGCGKTTTLRSLVGFINPTKGNIYIYDQDITKTPIEKREISMVFQSYALFPTLSVYENIAFGLRVKKLSKTTIKEMITDIALKVDLNDQQLHKKVSELSGGQQQRVAIARALVMQPKILVLDEPLSNLDAKLRKQLRNELKSLQKKFGITTIYVTHDQEEALTLSDRIAVFNNGVVEQVGTPEEIYNRSATEFVCNFIGDNNNVTKIIAANETRFREIMNGKSQFFVRIEKVTLIQMDQVVDTKGEDSIILEGIILEKEFYGMYTRYSIECEDGTMLKTIEKENTASLLDIGEKIKIVIAIQDVLAY